MFDPQEISVNDLDQIGLGPPAPDSPAEVTDPLKASLALAIQTTSEWLISPLTSRSSRSYWHALTVGALPPWVAVKIIYHQDDLRGDRALRAFAHRIDANVLVRTSRSRIPTMMISDRRSAIVFVTPEPKSGTAVKTEQPGAVSVLSTLFDQAWNAGTPLTPDLESIASKSQPELAQPEVELLRLLAAGVTDETAARHLGVSPRTARRHIANLMSRLAATSRFQAGVEAVKRGWLN